MLSMGSNLAGTDRIVMLMNSTKANSAQLYITRGGFHQSGALARDYGAEPPKKKPIFGHRRRIKMPDLIRSLSWTMYVSPIA